MRQTQKKIDQLLERILETNSATVIAAYEKKITELEQTKLVTAEKIKDSGQNRHSFEEMFELAMGFLPNPWKLWETGNMALRKTVLRLAFKQRISYTRENGFLNPEKSLSFKALDPNFAYLKEMVPEGGFEPPTRGFSIHCSTPELLGHEFARMSHSSLGCGVLG